MQDTILINKVFTGSYLLDNIGHEFINLYKTDKGENYIYITPHGTIGKERNDRIEMILFVKYCYSGKYKIIAKAEGLHQFVKSSSEDLEKIHQEQTDNIDKNIKYGGVELYKIYRHNSSENDTAIYYTFKADSVWKPKNDIYIKTATNETGNAKEKTNNSFEYEEINSLGRQIRYIQKSDKKYKSLSDFINRQEWIPTEKLDEIDDSTKNLLDHDFIKLAGKENIELTYSNLLQYFFYSDKNIFKTFAKEILGITISEDYQIEREKYHIDLLINDEKNVIVIENKIKSGLNGLLSENDNKSHVVGGQLETYSNNINAECRNAKNGQYYNKTPYFFVFLPDYNTWCEQEIDKQNKNNPDNKWEIKKYSDIYDFFAKHRINTPYFDEFLYALYKQSPDNYLEHELNERLYKAIKKETKSLVGV